jgi:hypothetical protein
MNYQRLTRFVKRGLRAALDWRDALFKEDD